MATDINTVLDDLISGSGGRGGSGEKGQQQLLQLLLQNYIQGNKAAGELTGIATAPRTDAYGNKITYDPVTGWTTTATPTTRAILDGEQTEQLKGLTRDAPRNRAASERQDDRSRMGNDAFEEEFNKYRYRPRMTEQDYIGNAQRDLALDRQEGVDDLVAARSRGALRSGGGDAFTKALIGADGEGISDFDGILNQGRRQGMQDFLSFEGGKDSMGQRDVDFYRGIADDVTNTPVAPTGTSQGLDALGSQQLAQLLQVLSQNEATRTGNLGSLAQVIAAQQKG